MVTEPHITQSYCISTSLAYGWVYDAKEAEFHNLIQTEVSWHDFEIEKGQAKELDVLKEAQ